jgi:hypothetical protein
MTEVLEEFLIMLQEGTMLYMFYGSMGVLAWKCGEQLLKEAEGRYKCLAGEEDTMKKVAAFGKRSRRVRK